MALYAQNVEINKKRFDTIALINANAGSEFALLADSWHY